MTDYKKEQEKEQAFMEETQEDNFQRQFDQQQEQDDDIVETETQLKKKMLERKKLPILNDLFDMKDILLSNLKETETNTVFLITNQAYYLNSLGYKALAQEYASDLEVFLAAKSAIKGGYARLIATKAKEVGITRKVGDSLQP